MYCATKCFLCRDQSEHGMANYVHQLLQQKPNTQKLHDYLYSTEDTISFYCTHQYYHGLLIPTWSICDLYYNSKYLRGDSQKTCLGNQKFSKKFSCPGNCSWIKLCFTKLSVVKDCQYTSLQTKTSLFRTYWYFKKHHFEIFKYKNSTTAWYYACALTTKILSRLLVFIITNLYHSSVCCLFLTLVLLIEW